MIRTLKAKYGDEYEETALLSKLMAYCSKEAHSCVEKAAMIGFVKLRILEPDQNCRYFIFFFYFLFCVRPDYSILHGVQLETGIFSMECPF